MARNGNGPMQSYGFTGHLARVSGQHPWRVVAIWVVLFVAAIGITVGYPSELTTDFELTNNPETSRADKLIEERMTFNGQPQPDEYVVVASETLSVDDPAFRTYVDGLVADLTALDEFVGMAVNPYELNNPALFADDRSALIVPVIAAGDDVDVHPFLDLLDERDGDEGFTVVTGGGYSIDTAFVETSESDLMTGETIGISVALLVLVVVFGTLVAAGVPLILSILAIAIAFGVTMLAGHAFDLSIYVVNMMIMIGLAVGIDYTLFIVGRYREERQRGLEKMAAIVRTGDTASKAVLFSGLTVVTALLGMLIVPSSLFQSLGVGAIFVSLVAVAATLTLLPATLSLLGNGIERGRGRALMGTLAISLGLFALLFNAIGISTAFIAAYVVLAVACLILAIMNIDPFHRKRSSGGGFWNSLTVFVMRRPLLLVVTTAAFLLGASAFYFTIEMGESGISTLPHNATSYRAFVLMEEKFSQVSLEEPHLIVVDGDIDSPEVQASVTELKESLAGDDAFGMVTEDVNDSGDLMLMRVSATGDTRANSTMESIERLREDYIRAAFAGSDAEALVTGPTAFVVDFRSMVDQYTPIVFAFVLGVSFLLLLLAFRSVVVPLKSVIMNLLSVGAAYGLLVLVFQHGIGNELFGFQQVERIDAWVPLMMFSILFGLSMDYHVFLLSRIRERYDHTRDNVDSVAHGLRTTASMITGAALIMVAVFGGFAMGELSMFQQMGFGLATAVVLDATVVRSILVPASMRLLGDLNWYFPRWLEWLPKISVEGVPEPVADRPVTEGSVAD